MKQSTLVSLQLTLNKVSFFFCAFTYSESIIHKKVFLSKNKSLRFKSVFSVHDFLIKLGSLNQSLIQKGKLLTMIHTLLNVVF